MIGKGLLITILGLGIILALLEINIHANTSRSLSTTIDYYSEMEARLIANSGVEIYLEKMRDNKSMSGGYFTNNPLMGGSYSISITGPDSMLQIRSIGTYNGITHTSLVAAKRASVTLPSVSSSMYISDNNLNINLGGNINISGIDHNMDGTLGTGSSLPGITVSNPSDSANIVNNISPKITNAITGSGNSPSVATSQNSTNWNQITQNIVSAADYTLAAGTYSTGTVLGTAAAPKITYVNGDVNFGGTATGYGIMVVNGDITISGQFTFYGILLVYGQSQIEAQATGQATVYGSTMFVGQSVNFRAASGNASFLYSKQAISNAQTNLKSSQFQILNWWE